MAKSEVDHARELEWCLDVLKKVVHHRRGPIHGRKVLCCQIELDWQQTEYDSAIVYAAFEIDSQLLESSIGFVGESDLEAALDRPRPAMTDDLINLYHLSK